MTLPVSLSLAAARRVQRERAWLSNNVGLERADDFEHELRHALDLLGEHPQMGNPSPDNEDERHWFLRRSRFHVYYRVYPDEIRVVRLRHEKQRPLKT